MEYRAGPLSNPGYTRHDLPDPFPFLTPGITAADIVFVVEEKKHPTFEREGNDLIKTVVVDLHEALLGHKIFVSTLDGKSINVDVPEIVGPRFEKKLIGEGEYFPFTTFRRLNARSRLTLSFYRLSANIRCAATKSACGTYYTVTGEKKWITNGVWADFFTVAVRTGGPGMGGISLLVIEKTFKGVECKRMDCMGVWASGTSFVTFDEVKVPIANLIGKENAGFGYVMHNFNHERWGFVVQANRFARVCYEEAFLYAHKRRTFGKKLIEHPVIRAKLADMIRQIDATHHQMVRAAGGPFPNPGRLVYRSW
jgi:hypothetical protein